MLRVRVIEENSSKQGATVLGESAEKFRPGNSQVTIATNLGAAASAAAARSGIRHPEGLREQEVPDDRRVLSCLDIGRDDRVSGATAQGCPQHPLGLPAAGWQGLQHAPHHPKGTSLVAQISVCSCRMATAPCKYSILLKKLLISAYCTISPTSRRTYWFHSTHCHVNSCEGLCALVTDVPGTNSSASKMVWVHSE
jgi:hypothetical protein